MRKIISFMHISLDGFVCGPHGEMDWISIDQELFNHVENRIRQCDSALYGRITYDMMQSYWHTAADKPDATDHDRNHSKWYQHAQKIVLSNSLISADLINTTIVSGNIVEQINSIKNQEGPEILLFGSPSATHALIEKGLIDGYWLFVNPVIIGKGKALFMAEQDRTKLQLLSTRTFQSGIVELNYEVKR